MSLIFKGEKSNLYMLHQYIIYLNYLFLDTSLINQAQYAIEADWSIYCDQAWFFKFKDEFENKG